MPVDAQQEHDKLQNLVNIVHRSSQEAWKFCGTCITHNSILLVIGKEKSDKKCCMLLKRPCSAFLGTEATLCPSLQVSVQNKL